ncbi:MAG: cyclic peptide export ABC transporter [Gammaproteobacteria bacterium]|nr:cyclic peptide export ABC transporter [Gammaproteobacteria bacterium]
MINLNELGLYKLIVKEDKGAWFSILIAACFAGFLQGCIIFIINQVAGNVNQGGLNLRYLLFFILTISVYSFANHYANSRAIAVTESIIFSLYVSIADKIRKARTLSFENIGKSRVYTTLHNNTDIILEASKYLSGIGAAFVMIIFSIVYIASMSGIAVFTIIIFYTFGIFVYKINFNRIRVHIDQANSHEAIFKGLFGHFLEGFKEIKVDQNKSDDLFNNYIQQASDKAKDSGVRSENLLAVNTVFVQSFYYILIGAMIFLLPRIANLDTLVIIKIAAIVLFSYGSMTRVVQAIPLLLKSERAINELDRLGKDFSEAVDNSEAMSSKLSNVWSDGSSLEVKNLCFNYQTNNKHIPFSLSQISFNINPGELIFITGGNGSGKTTLLKLLAGLYTPSSGQLILDNDIVDENNYASYRNLFSVIFPDYYIFDRLYGEQEVNEDLIKDGLLKLGLIEKVHWHDACFSELKLSAGQRKRLALLFCYIDTSPFLVMDEVAADLDPQFRKFFYEKFLKEFQAQGKTIIAVSHDEKYFDLADQLIQIENGKIVAR